MILRTVIGTRGPGTRRPAWRRSALLATGVSLIAAALLAGPALAGGDKKGSRAYDWEEITLRDGKAVQVRRGKKGDEPYRLAEVDRRVGPLSPEPGPPPGFVPPGEDSVVPSGVLARTVESTSVAGDAAKGSGDVPVYTGETSEEAYGVNCKVVRASEEGRGFSYFNTLYRFWLANYFCWDYPRITTFSSWAYFSDLEGIEIAGVAGGGSWYSWRGADHGGHYSLRQAHVRNCPGILGWIPFGPDCTGSQYPTVEIWLNGNGAWTARSTGGGYYWH